MNENYIYLAKRLDLLVLMNNGITKNDLYELDTFNYSDFVLIYSSYYWDILCKANLCDYFWTMFLSKGDFTKKWKYDSYSIMNNEFAEWYNSKLKLELNKL